MEINHGEKIILGILTSVLLIFLGYIFLSRDNFYGEITLYRRGGAFGTNYFAGVGFFLFLPVSLLYTMYQIKEWRDKKKREKIQNYFHPLHPDSRAFVDENED